MTKISAFVVTCDKDPTILRAVLHAARFVDDLILIDKSRSPAYRTVARSIADDPAIHARYIPIPWTPTVEGSRAQGVRACDHDWIVCLDDDEILSPACAARFREIVHDGSVRVLDVPIRHHILGRFDASAYYFPEWRPALFRRGAVEFGSTVHAGTQVLGRRLRLDENGSVYIDHLSHSGVSQWLEKTNRYTDQPDRSGTSKPFENAVLPWAVGQLAAYVRGGGGRDDYVDVVAILRGIYDIIDGLKRWETNNLSNGDEAFVAFAHQILWRSPCGS